MFSVYNKQSNGYAWIFLSHHGLLTTTPEVSILYCCRHLSSVAWSSAGADLGAQSTPLSGWELELDCLLIESFLTLVETLCFPCRLRTCKKELNCLSSIPNTHSRVITRSLHYSCHTSDMKALHWLLCEFRVTFKIPFNWILEVYQGLFQ